MYDVELNAFEQRTRNTVFKHRFNVQFSEGSQVNPLKYMDKHQNKTDKRNIFQ